MASLALWYQQSEPAQLLPHRLSTMYAACVNVKKTKTAQLGQGNRKGRKAIHGLIERQMHKSVMKLIIQVAFKENS